LSTADQNLTPMPTDSIELLRFLYERFNARDIDAILPRLTPDVSWENGFEGGHVTGHLELRSYWTLQWQTIDPHVEPLSFTEGAEDEILVEVHQLVRDLQGELLMDVQVGHIFHLTEGRVRRFDIRPDAAD
jgi:hypothetical protein